MSLGHFRNLMVITRYTEYCSFAQFAKNTPCLPIAESIRKIMPSSLGGWGWVYLSINRIGWGEIGNPKNEHTEVSTSQKVPECVS